MTMAAIAVRTVLVGTSPVKLDFVPALVARHGDQIVFDLVWADRPKDEDVCDFNHDLSVVHHGRYVGRFGDLCCASCDTPLAWSPGWVKAGLYGDPKETYDWILGSLSHNLAEVGAATVDSALAIVANYDLLSDEQIDVAYGHK